jgi:subtilisin family serine protease
MKRFARFALPISLAAVIASLLPVSPSIAQSPDTLFEGSATIQAGHPLSITDLEFAITCPLVPLSQGVDGHVFDLGFDSPAGATFTATGVDALNTADVDAYFYDGDCSYISGAEEIGDEAGELPTGTHYVSVVAFQGVQIDATLTVSGAEPTPDPTPSPTPTGTPGERTRGTYPATPNDPLFADQWGMTNIQAPAAWQEPAGTGFEINIAVVDSGIDIGHPDFACAPWKLKVLPGSNFNDPNEPPQDDAGHGTHVAGIAAACANNGEGVVGVAPDATIIPVKYSDTDDLDKTMADGINFATENGAHVINLSFGPAPGFSYLPAYPDTQDALQAAHEAGVVVVAASGNFSQPLCEFPSLSEHVICVSATDRNDQKAYYSDLPNNVDPESDEPGIEPSVMAPGGQGTFCDEGIVSTYLRGLESVCYSDGYESLDGTSMSSPHVAGVAALVYDALGGQRNKANADAVIDAIISSADDLLAPGYDPITGYGRVNALKAVQAATGQ